MHVSGRACRSKAVTRLPLIVQGHCGTVRTGGIAPPAACSSKKHSLRHLRLPHMLARAQANVGDYEASARFYVRALQLNPQAASVWGYLRNSLACAGRMDLMGAFEAEDLPALQQALPL